MRLLLGVCCVILSTVIGSIISEKYLKRKKFYNDFYNFNQRMISEVSFRQSPLKNIIETNYSTFSTFICEIIFNDKKDISIKFLSEDENRFVKDYALSLGKLDSLSQLNYLKSVDAQISTFYKNSAENEKRYKKLYIKLGFLIGLILLVIVL